jgi:hypothetical protein
MPDVGDYWIIRWSLSSGGQRADRVADDNVGECGAVAPYSAAGECTMVGGSL